MRKKEETCVGLCYATFRSWHWSCQWQWHSRQRPHAGRDIYVANYGTGTIGEYTTSGAVVNASLVSGLNDPNGIAVSGSNLFVANYGNGTIGEYTTSGAVVNASLVSGLSGPNGIAVSGSNLFVTNHRQPARLANTPRRGQRVNASLVSGLNDPDGIAVSGSNLFVTNARQRHDWRIHHVGGNGERLPGLGVE